MRYVLTFLFMSMLALAAVACDANAPLGGQCHSRTDGSVLKAVEDANGKQWRVMQYPAGITVGISSDMLCAVPIQARESAFIDETSGYWKQAYFLHPEDGERIDAGVFGSYQGFLDLDSDYEWY